MSFGGVFSVLPTPFDPTGDFDPDSLRRVIDLFIADGVNGFTALGVTSEVARLADAERDRVAIRKEVLKRRGAIASAAIRAPGGKLDDGTSKALDRVLAWTQGGY